jgi:hypothetical protein
MSLPKQAFSIHIRRGVDKLACVRVTITNPETGTSADFEGAIDTGCTFIAISEKVVKTLHFTARDTMWVSSSSDTTKRNIYFPTLVICNSEDSITFAEQQAVDFIATPSIDVLIGMNVLRQGDLCMTEDNAGNTIVSFRMPHGECIDFER